MTSRAPVAARPAPARCARCGTASTAALAHCGRVGHRQERPGGQARASDGRRPATCGSAASRSGRRPRRGGPVAGVLHHRGQPHARAYGPGSSAAVSRTTPSSRCAAAHQPPDRPPGVVAHRLGLLAGRPGRTGSVHVLARPVRRPARRARRAPRRPRPRASAPGRRSSSSVGPSGTPPSGAGPLDDRGAGRAGSAARPAARRRCAAPSGTRCAGGRARRCPPPQAGRHQDAELPAQPVLGGRGAVGVEHVALEEHGVGDRRAASNRRRARPARRRPGGPSRSVGRRVRSRSARWRRRHGPAGRRGRGGRAGGPAPSAASSSVSYGRVPGRQRPARPVGEQRVHGVARQPQPAAAGEVLLDHLPPHRDRHPEGRLAVPGHRLAPGSRRGRRRRCRRRASAAAPRRPSSAWKYRVAAMSMS